MRFHYVSDLHLEFGYVPELPGGDILLIAGDTVPVMRLDFEESAQRIKRYSEVCRRFSVLMNETKKYQHSYIIMGNHEHYHGNFHKTRNKFEEILSEHSNITLLENEMDIIYPGLRIYGATFWTDYGNFYGKNLDAARLGMNDHHLVSENRDGGIGVFKPETAYDVNRACRNDLKFYVEQYPNDNFVVMTHHTPSMSCGNEKWGGPENKLNYAFHNTDLDEFIKSHPNIKHWVAGHTHDSYEGKIGECQIHINPRGYVSSYGNPENVRFDQTLYFEVNL